MHTVLDCQGCGTRHVFGFQHYVDCNPIANGDCDCLGRMIDTANADHHPCPFGFGEELMRPLFDKEEVAS